MRVVCCRRWFVRTSLTIAVLYSSCAGRFVGACRVQPGLKAAIGVAGSCLRHGGFAAPCFCLPCRAGGARTVTLLAIMCASHRVETVAKLEPLPRLYFGIRRSIHDAQRPSRRTQHHALCRVQVRLCQALASLPQDQFELAMALVLKDHPGLQPTDDIGLDIDALDALTLRQLQVSGAAHVFLARSSLV
jgi:hypothetical protein